LISNSEIILLDNHDEEHNDIVVLCDFGCPIQPRLEQAVNPIPFLNIDLN
jgi:hypothetical protein